MPRRRFRWWRTVTDAMGDAGNEQVLAALELARETLPEWDYMILMDAIENRYRRRRKTLFQVGRDHGVTEKYVWKGIVQPFIFEVAAEMGFVEKRAIKNLIV